MADRTRQKESSKPEVTNQWEWKRYTGGVLTGQSTTLTNYSPEIVQISMEDTEIPNFYARSKRGEIFCNPMLKTTEIFRDTVCYADFTGSTSTITDRFVGSRYYGKVGEHPHHLIDKSIWDESLISSTKDLAVTRSWANTDQSKAAYLVTLGELNETIEMAVDLMHRTTKYSRWLRKKKYAKLLKEAHPKNWSDIWLSIRYGLRPLLGDAKAIADALSTSLERANRQTFRGFVAPVEVLKADTVWTKDSEGYLWYHDIDLQSHRASRFTVEARAGVLTEVTRTSLGHVLGVYNPVQAIYDLAMLSFMLDWIWNVGDTLASFSPKAGLKPLASWVTVTATLDCTSEIIGWRQINGSSKSGTFSSGKAQYIKKIVERIPNPSLRILPQLDVHLSATKLIDMVLIGRNITNKLFIGI